MPSESLASRVAGAGAVGPCLEHRPGGRSFIRAATPFCRVRAALASGRPSGFVRVSLGLGEGQVRACVGCAASWDPVRWQRLNYCPL